MWADSLGAGPDDEDHPRNYSALTKGLVRNCPQACPSRDTMKEITLTGQLIFNVFVLTFMTYMVSSIYTLGISGPGSVQEEFGVSLTTGV